MEKKRVILRKFSSDQIEIKVLSAMETNFSSRPAFFFFSSPFFSNYNYFLFLSSSCCFLPSPFFGIVKIGCAFKLDKIFFFPRNWIDVFEMLERVWDWLTRKENFFKDRYREEKGKNKDYFIWILFIEKNF